MNLEKLKGYINLYDFDASFYFKNNKLIVIPSNHKDYITIKTDSFFGHNYRTNKEGFIENIIVNGYCFNGNEISICILDFPKFNDEEELYFDVIWVFKKTNSVDKPVNCIEYCSQEINCFYDTFQYVKEDFEIKNGKHNELTLKVLSTPKKELGYFKYNKSKITIFGNKKWKRSLKYNNNLEIWATLSLESKFELSLEDIYHISITQKAVIDFLSYRTNNLFDSIELYSVDKDSNRIFVGYFYLVINCEPEKNIRNVDHIIKYNNIENLGIIYSMILDKKIYFSHFSENHNGFKKYNPLRMLGIIIAFEYICNWKYSNEELRNEQYVELLGRIKLLIDNNSGKLLDGLSKRKTRFASTVKFITKPQKSFSTLIHKVIKDYPVLLSFIENNYMITNPSEYVEILSTRINKFRNDMVHGNKIDDFNDIFTKDLKFMEQVYYYLLLKEIGLSDDEIVNKIAYLFEIRFFINNKEH